MIGSASSCLTNTPRKSPTGLNTPSPKMCSTTSRNWKTIIPNSGTNLFAGLNQGIQSLDADRSSALILVTDGVANLGYTEKKDFLELLEQTDVRLFTFVLGNSSNRPLLESMAKVSNGFAINVSNGDDIAGKILEATSKAHPRGTARCRRIVLRGQGQRPDA